MSAATKTGCGSATRSLEPRARIARPPRRRVHGLARTGKITAPEAAKKLSYRERRELEALPARIEGLEVEQRTLNGTIADSAFYRQPADAIAATLDRLQRVERDLGDLYAQWAALDSRPR